MILEDQLTRDGGSEHGEGEADGGRDEGRRGAGRHGRAERGAGDLDEWGTWGVEVEDRRQGLFVFADRNRNVKVTTVERLTL